MKYLLLIALLFPAVHTFSQSYSGPESAEYDALHGRWLIANTTSHEVIARDSFATLSVFVGGLGSGPYGIEIVGDTLFCCCGSSIKGYLLSNASQVFNLNVGATFLNGLTHDNAGNLFATDFSAKKIFKINIATQAFSAVATALVQSPNGIVFDGDNNRCVFVNWGSSAPVKAIDLTTFAVSTIIPTSLSNCDDITRDSQGRYYISNWGAQSVVRYDSAFAGSPTTVVTGLSNPADIYFNILDDTLAIPNAGNNTVRFSGISPVVGVHETEFIKTLYLFPNPAANEVTIHHQANIDIEEVIIYDVTGMTVGVPELIQRSQAFSVNISSLPDGMYFLKIKTPVGDGFAKFLKQARSRGR